MKAIAINGSPRKGWNTDLLLKQALKGASDAGAETELIQLSLCSLMIIPNSPRELSTRNISAKRMMISSPRI